MNNLRSVRSTDGVKLVKKLWGMMWGKPEIRVRARDGWGYTSSKNNWGYCNWWDMNAHVCNSWRDYDIVHGEQRQSCKEYF